MDVITINTDASRCPHTSAGGFAYWIKGPGFHYKGSGAFKDLVDKPHEAELKALLNAVYILEKNGHDFDLLIINTDCKIITHRRYFNITEYLQKWHNLHGTRCRDIQFRHVKAHEHTSTARNWVNDWCDRQAKKHMRKKRHFLQSKI